MRSELIHKIFLTGPDDFEPLALAIFRYQYQHNKVYREYCKAIHRPAEQVHQLTDIPFLPIRFFKSHAITTGTFEAETWFESSGTTQTINSRHYVRSLELYQKNFMEGFRLFYGEPTDWCIIGLLPAYLERQHSSLVVMADALIKASGHADSGFYLYDYERLHDTLSRLEAAGQPTLLLGVTFALLDFAEQFPMALKHTVIMETGGMKGRRKEMTRPELHAILQSGLRGARIHSEYGMTELLSQAYSQDNGIFHCPPWMKVVLREEDDPFRLWAATPGDRKSLNGVINVIDLVNIDSCAFIATDDMGKLYPGGGFEVLGRLDNSDIRGCSLMVL
ncbi:acyl transferase [Flavihumibacter rivuli]|uniref:LuxE/PaaK family acyltransferase n=1 Tax=Flavihumibacter rivuli TaxID=2838156 RepID=UPI001BDF22AD|nr:acyl transferase [Flavihumibacter rivuli]ULQ57161.1 acyl transferase [Flavihumibacter rivuli]